MATGMEKAPVTELNVQMDCNGCAQRIKKAMHSIDGVYDAYVDLPQQKLTVVGRADPETLVKAIKKVRKVATICSYTDPGASEPPPTEPEAASSPPDADAPPQENHAPEEAKPAPEAQVLNQPETKDVMREHWNDYPPMGHQNQHEAPYTVTTPTGHHPMYQGMDTSGHLHKIYHTAEAHGQGYYQNEGDENHGSGGNQITSMFSDENPNACGIV